MRHTIATRRFRPVAMSVLASGAISPREAIEYVCRQPAIKSIVFGASSRANIKQTKALIDELTLGSGAVQPHERRWDHRAGAPGAPRGLPAGNSRLSRLRLRDGRQNFRFSEQFEPDVFWKQHGKKILALAAARCWIRDYPGKPVAAQPRFLRN